MKIFPLAPFHLHVPTTNAQMYCCLTEEELADRNQKADLCMLVKRLVRTLEAVSPNNELSTIAMDFIKNATDIGKPLR